ESRPGRAGADLRARPPRQARREERSRRTVGLARGRDPARQTAQRGRETLRAGHRSRLEAVAPRGAAPLRPDRPRPVRTRPAHVRLRLARLRTGRHLHPRQRRGHRDPRPRGPRRLLGNRGEDLPTGNAMKYLRIGRPGYETPVVAHDGKHYDMSGPIGDIDGEFLARGGVSSVAGFPEIDIAGERVAPPIAKPGAVVCIGMNYAAHCAESGAEPPAEPVVFFKHPNTIVGPHDDIEIPRGSSRTDWEVELGVVFGKRASYLESEEAAMDCAAGFVVANDVSEREFQIER